MKIFIDQINAIARKHNIAASVIATAAINAYAAKCADTQAPAIGFTEIPVKPVYDLPEISAQFTANGSVAFYTGKFYGHDYQQCTGSRIGIEDLLVWFEYEGMNLNQSFALLSEIIYWGTATADYLPPFIGDNRYHASDRDTSRKNYEMKKLREYAKTQCKFSYAERLDRINHETGRVIFKADFALDAGIGKPVQVWLAPSPYTHEHTAVVNGIICVYSKCTSKDEFVKTQLAGIVDKFKPVDDTPPADNPPVDTPPADDTPETPSAPVDDTPPADNPPVDTPPADDTPEMTPPVDATPEMAPPVDDTSKNPRVVLFDLLKEFGSTASPDLDLLAIDKALVKVRQIIMKAPNGSTVYIYVDCWVKGDTVYTLTIDRNSFRMPQYSQRYVLSHAALKKHAGIETTRLTRKGDPFTCKVDRVEIQYPVKHDAPSPSPVPVDDTPADITPATPVNDTPPLPLKKSFLRGYQIDGTRAYDIGGKNCRVDFYMDTEGDMRAAADQIIAPARFEHVESKYYNFDTASHVERYITPNGVKVEFHTAAERTGEYAYISGKLLMIALTDGANKVYLNYNSNNHHKRPEPNQARLTHNQLQAVREMLGLPFESNVGYIGYSVDDSKRFVEKLDYSYQNFLDYIVKTHNADAEILAYAGAIAKALNKIRKAIAKPHANIKALEDTFRDAEKKFFTLKETASLIKTDYIYFARDYFNKFNSAYSELLTFEKSFPDAITGEIRRSIDEHKNRIDELGGQIFGNDAKDAVATYAKAIERLEAELEKARIELQNCSGTDNLPAVNPNSSDWFSDNFTEHNAELRATVDELINAYRDDTTEI